MRIEHTMLISRFLRFEYIDQTVEWMHSIMRYENDIHLLFSCEIMRKTRKCEQFNGGI